MSHQKQLKVVSPTYFYSFQGGLISVERVDQLNQLKSGFFLKNKKEKLNQHEEP